MRLGRRWDCGSSLRLHDELGAWGNFGQLQVKSMLVTFTNRNLSPSVGPLMPPWGFHCFSLSGLILPSRPSFVQSTHLSVVFWLSLYLLFVATFTLLKQLCKASANQTEHQFGQCQFWLRESSDSSNVHWLDSTPGVSHTQTPRVSQRYPVHMPYHDQTQFTWGSSNLTSPSRWT